MKKTLLAICIVCAAVISGNAQSKIGVQGALNASGVRGNSNVDGILSFQAGLVGDIDFTENVFITSGVLYTDNGWKLHSIIDDAAIKNTKKNFGYVPVPICIGGKFNPIDDVALFAQAGAYGAYCLTDKIGEERWDYGLTAGIGSYLLDRIKIGIYYDLGLKEVQYDTKWSNLHIGAAYYF